MPILPAICPNCGAVFDTGVLLQSSGNSFTGCVSPCPKCGTMGIIPNGEYSAAGHSLRVIAATAGDEVMLRRIQAVMQQALASGKSDKAILEEELKRAGVSDSQKIVEAAPGGQNFVVWLTVVLIVIQILLQLPAGIRDWNTALADLTQTYPQLRGMLP